MATAAYLCGLRFVGAGGGPEVRPGTAFGAPEEGAQGIGGGAMNFVLAKTTAAQKSALWVALFGLCLLFQAPYLKTFNYPQVLPPKGSRVRYLLTG